MPLSQWFDIKKHMQYSLRWVVLQNDRINHVSSHQNKSLNHVHISSVLTFIILSAS